MLSKIIDLIPNSQNILIIVQDDELNPTTIAYSGIGNKQTLKKFIDNYTKIIDHKVISITSGILEGESLSSLICIKVCIAIEHK